jgi:RecB family exonuclease
VLAVEAPGEVRVANAAGEARSLHFVADRVDASPHGVRLVDYKTGRPLGVQQSEARRRAALERAVASGRSLQAIAYALGGPAHTTAPSIGEYVYLRPDVPDHARSLVASADDAPLEESFRKATATLIEAREAGSFFPRLVDGSGDAEPRRCRACSVKEACLRGDSAARHRQRRWIENADAAPGEPSHSARHARGSQAHRSERALLALWQLGGDG